MRIALPTRMWAIQPGRNVASPADREELSIKADGFARAARGDAMSCNPSADDCDLFNEAGDAIPNATVDH